MQRAGLIDDEEQRQLALFHERLHEGMAHARRHIPVDGAEIVAMLVFADLRELDALAAEDGTVLAGEEGVDQVPRPELDPLHVLQDFGRDRPPPAAQR